MICINVPGLAQEGDFTDLLGMPSGPGALLALFSRAPIVPKILADLLVDRFFRYTASN